MKDKYKININIINFKKKSCKERYNKGYDIYIKDEVKLISFKENLIHGFKKHKLYVKGNKNNSYKVKIFIDKDNNIISKCSCPDFINRCLKNNNDCKHCIASILHIS